MLGMTFIKGKKIELNERCSITVTVIFVIYCTNFSSDCDDIF